jgi:hypothetical protein
MPCSIIADRHHFREAGAAVDGEWPAKQHCLRWPRVRRHAWLGRKRIMTSSPVAFADLVKDGSAASSRPASTSLQFRLDLHRFSPERSAASVRARSSNVQRHDAGRCPAWIWIQAAGARYGYLRNRSAAAVPRPTCRIQLETPQYKGSRKVQSVPDNTRTLCDKACKPLASARLQWGSETRWSSAVAMLFIARSHPMIIGDRCASDHQFDRGDYCNLDAGCLLDGAKATRGVVARSDLR